jgi:hypothetical protein
VFGAYHLNTLDEWSSVLHLADEWDLETVRSLAIKQLSLITTPVDKLALGHRYAIHDWLLDAYVSLCERDELLTQAEGRRLGVDDVIFISLTRQELQSRSMSPDEVLRTVWRTCCSNLEEPVLMTMHADEQLEERPRQVVETENQE